MVGEIMSLSLRSAILEYTGIADAYIGDVVTGLLFVLAVLLVFACLSKFIFKM